VIAGTLDKGQSRGCDSVPAWVFPSLSEGGILRPFATHRTKTGLPATGNPSKIAEKIFIIKKDGCQTGLFVCRYGSPIFEREATCVKRTAWALEKDQFLQPFRLSGPHGV
jgi:hypothetical protein